MFNYKYAKLLFYVSYFIVEKEEMQNIREKAVARVQEKAKEDAEARAKRKRENEKYSLEVMMKVGNIHVWFDNKGDHIMALLDGPKQAFVGA